MNCLDLLKEILSQKQFLYRSLLMMVLLTVSYYFILDNGKETIKRLISILKQPWLAAFFFYSAFILTSTVFARTRINPYRSVFKSFGILIDGKLNSELVNNTLLFIPFSYLFLQAFKPKNTWGTVLILSAVTTLFIELSQLLFWLGEFQFSDIVHNIIGGVVGCGLWHLTNRMVRKRKQL